MEIEVKTWLDKTLYPEEKGLDQLEAYLARIKADYGWLCIFDRRKNAPAFLDRLLSQRLGAPLSHNRILYYNPIMEAWF